MQPTENLGNLNTNGVDVNLQFRFAPTPYGRFGVTMDGTYVTKYEYQREKGGVYIQNAGRLRRQRADIPLAAYDGPQLHARAVERRLCEQIQVWVHGPGSRQRSRRATRSLICSVPGQGYKGLTLTAGIKNLFDEDPPFSNQVNDVPTRL